MVFAVLEVQCLHSSKFEIDDDLEEELEFNWTTSKSDNLSFVSSIDVKIKSGSLYLKPNEIEEYDSTIKFMDSRRHWSINIFFQLHSRNHPIRTPVDSHWMEDPFFFRKWGELYLMLFVLGKIMSFFFC